MNRSPIALAPLLIALAAGLAYAQDQPATAVNNQEETIVLERPVEAGTEEFKVLRSGNKAETNRYVTRVYPLKHAHPYEMLPYLRSVASLEKGSVITAWNPQPSGPTLAWIQVNVPEFQLPFIDAAVAAYDVENFVSSGGDIKFSYRTKYRDAEEVADFMRITSVSSDGAIRADAATNTIYVVDSPSDFRRTLAQIQFYDVPIPQVDLEVQLLELMNVDQTSLGLDWDAWKSTLGGRIDLQRFSRRDQPDEGLERDVAFRSYDGLLSLDATVLARFLNYLVDEGKAEVRVRTNLTVSNGTVAVLSSASQVPDFQYVYNKDQNRSTLTEAPSTPADPAVEGFTVRLSPNIAMNAARLDVDVTLRNPAAIAKNGSTIFADQRVSANLTLEQGQLYKVGGLRRKVSATETKGVPVLRHIPLVRYLFSNETTILRETELYLFLRPVWTAPALPALDGMQGDKPQQVTLVQDLLRANTNLAIGAEDAALLQRYFNAMAVAPSTGLAPAQP